MSTNTSVALLSQSFDMAPLQPLLRAADPQLDVAIWPDPRCLEAEIAVCWDTPPGLYARMPRLKLVHSMAAGVDNVVAGQTLGQTPVCRVMDPLLAEGMLQFVLWGVLHFHRCFDAVLANQPLARWNRPAQTPASACRIGIMGLGALGGFVAQRLPLLGYTRVNGWTRTARSAQERQGLQDVRLFHGETGWPDFLGQTDVLVCLLPLTAQTRGILNQQTFAGLPRGSALVHCGRGEHLIETDLIDALNGGHLRGAVLDVFETEPLPTANPLWYTPGVVVTPHMASTAAFDTVAEQVARNIRQLRQGAPLYHQVDMARGY